MYVHETLLPNYNFSFFFIDSVINIIPGGLDVDFYLVFSAELHSILVYIDISDDVFYFLSSCLVVLAHVTFDKPPSIIK